jgi:hypothetical protein
MPRELSILLGMLVCTLGCGTRRGESSPEGPVRCTSCGEDAELVPDAGARWYGWLAQFGSAGTDELYAVGEDADGNFLVAGATYGELPNQTAVGQGDVLVAKLEGHSGKVLWQRQFGTEVEDWAAALVVDPRGDFIVAGSTLGALSGSNAGDGDAFLSKRSGVDGSELWTVQFGADGYDAVSALALGEDGDCFVLGTTTSVLGAEAFGGDDVFLERRSCLDGELRFTIQTGGEGNDSGLDLALDGAGRVVVAGYTESDLEGRAQAGGGDGFVGVYDAADGALRWLELRGTSLRDYARAVSLGPNGDVFVAGETDGVFGAQNFGATDAFVERLDGGTGARVWVQQFGTETWDFALSLEATHEQVLVGGDSYGEFAAGRVKARDPFVAFLSSEDGSALGAVQFGTLGHDFSLDITSGASGSAVLVGTTGPGLDGAPGLGGFDAFVVEVPAP